MTEAGSARRVCIAITTYCRPQGLTWLLDDIERQWPAGEPLDLRIYDDGSPATDAAFLERARANGWSYLRAPVNHGRTRWWQWWNIILADLRSSAASVFYVLQDDMRLCADFFGRAGRLWDAIPDDAKGALDLHVAQGRDALGSTCWTGIPAQAVGEVIRSGWIDCAAFLAPRRLLDKLGWRLDPISPRRWAREPSLSSGVGRQVSMRAVAQGLMLYRVSRSLTVHDDSPSLLNADVRRRTPLRTAGFVDGDAAEAQLRSTPAPVLAALASIQAREAGLAQVVASLLPQVDRLGVYLNGYDHVPDFLRDDRIDVARSQEHGDNGDAGKFHWAPEASGYYLACDDDLVYPFDYVERVLAGIDRYRRQAVVGFHGSVLHPEIRDYHRSRRLTHFSRGLDTDEVVHVLSTGSLGFHTSALALERADFRQPNMADLWLALVAQRQRVPLVCLRRPARWLVEIPALPGDSIYAEARRRAARGTTVETELVCSHTPWVLHRNRLPEPLVDGKVALPERTAPVLTTPVPVPTPPVPAVSAPAPAPAVRTGTRQRVPRSAPPLAQLPMRRHVPIVRVVARGPSRQGILALPAGDHITATVRSTGTYYEADLLAAILARRPDGTYIDVGAHHGNHVAFFGLECGAEQIIAIEPAAAAFAGLVETVARNGLSGRVQALPIAVHPTSRSVVLRPPERQSAVGRARGNSGMLRSMPAEGPDAVPAAPLDELLADAGPVGLIKVDTAGSSADVLRSASRTLRRDRPLVAAATQSRLARDEVRDLLAPLGYREAGPYCWTPTWLWEPPAPGLSS